MGEDDAQFSLGQIPDSVDNAAITECIVTWPPHMQQLFTSGIYDEDEHCLTAISTYSDEQQFFLRRMKSSAGDLYVFCLSAEGANFEPVSTSGQMFTTPLKAFIQLIRTYKLDPVKQFSQPR